jgi:uroporphyrin-III C-methyltransferase
VKVYLVGAGPGAADLLTLRAARLLALADVVFFDALISEDILALAPHAEKIFVGKRCGAHATAQRFINKRLADAAARHACVVRLKGGDPMLFGRAHEEIAYLKSRGIAVEVVPGITAALGAGAELQVSLTRRGVSRSVVFATPRAAAGEAASDWARAVAAADTAVLYMASREAAKVRDALLAAGLRADTPVAVAQGVSAGATLKGGELRDLPLLARACTGPAVLLLGAVFREFVGISTHTVDKHVGKSCKSFPYAL